MAYSPETRSQIRTDIANSPRTTWRFSDYKNILGYTNDADDISGKMVLDVGAGDSTFAKEASQRGAFVVRIDPRYNTSSRHLSINEQKLYEYGVPKHKKNAIAAIAQELPFRDESFDEVVALYSAFWIKTMTQDAVKEMLRVTKENGNVRIWPVPHLTKDQITCLPHFIHAGRVNPDYGHPTSLKLTKNKDISLSDWNEVIVGTITKVIVASDRQFSLAENEAKRADKLLYKRKLRNF